MLVAALAAVGVLALVVGSVIMRGHSALTLAFFTKVPATFGESGGGIANSIAGTIVIVACATVLALPLGVLIAIYTSELAPLELRRFIGLVLDVLNGLPSIVIGIFIFGDRKSVV